MKISSRIIQGRKIQDELNEREAIEDFSKLGWTRASFNRLSFREKLFVRKYIETKIHQEISTQIFDIDVVIPVYGSSPKLLECLESLEQSIDCNIKVFLINNGAPQDLLDECENMGIVKDILNNGNNLGFGQGCDLGIRSANSKYIVLLNSDALVLPSTLKNLCIAKQDHPNCAVIAATCFDENMNVAEHGRVIKSDGHSFGYGENDNPNDSRFSSFLDVLYASYVCVLIDKEAYIEIGGFDPAYHPAYYEDSDLSLRFRDMGKRVGVSTSKVIHSVGTSTSSIVEIEEIKERNRQYFINKFSSTFSEIPDDTNFVDYPHEIELLVHFGNEEKILIVANVIDDKTLELINKKLSTTFVSILVRKISDATLNHLREQGCEVSIGYGKTKHHWFRERICLYDNVYAQDKICLEEVAELVKITQPNAELSVI